MAVPAWHVLPDVEGPSTSSAGRRWTMYGDHPSTSGQHAHAAHYRVESSTATFDGLPTSEPTWNSSGCFLVDRVSSRWPTAGGTTNFANKKLHLLLDVPIAVTCSSYIRNECPALRVLCPAAYRCSKLVIVHRGCLYTSSSIGIIMCLCTTYSSQRLFCIF